MNYLIVLKTLAVSVPWIIFWGQSKVILMFLCSVTSSFKIKIFPTLLPPLKVLTRFLFSSCPVLLVFAAHLVTKGPDGNFFNTQGPQSVIGIMRKICSWFRNGPWSVFILMYFSIYFVSGLIIHCNFLPWTWDCKYCIICSLWPMTVSYSLCEVESEYTYRSVQTNRGLQNCSVCLRIEDLNFDRQSESWCDQRWNESIHSNACTVL